MRHSRPPSLAASALGSSVLLVVGWAGAFPLAAQPEHFHYDRTDRPVASTVIDGPGRYDPHVAVVGNDVWLTWLAFTPGEGDRIQVARHDGEISEVTTIGPPGRYACPTLTPRPDGVLRLTYEAQDPERGDWDIWMRELGPEAGEPRRISDGPGPDIAHRVHGDWIVWQSDNGGQFDVVARRLQDDAAPMMISSSPRGDWRPDVAVTPDGGVCVVWDSYHGGTFDVLARWRVDGVWLDPVAVAAGPSFEARARVAAGGPGRCWVVWEEGARNWGAPYRSVERQWNNSTDLYGPVHRLRQLRLAALTPESAAPLTGEPFPMPSLAAAASSDDRRPGVRALGVFYERAELSVDASGRPWVAYRHYFEPQIGRAEPVVHHVEHGFGIYARCLEGEGWSPLYGFDVLQRDGMQRLAIAPTADGLAVVWDTGRTDRRVDTRPRGVVVARLRSTPGPRPEPGTPAERSAPPDPAPRATRPRQASVAGEPLDLFFGDLHRHTDLSLCFPFFDGTIDDAYRYAIEVAELDFMGITDHTRDIARGDALSQLWWRSTKEVGRHELGGTFAPFFAYERSHGHTDHNVISLRDDMLRNFPPPLPEFWQEIEDGKTITIPHAPFIGNVWHHHDDERRPLLEIFQGCRDRSSEEHAHEGLHGGHHVGFIASSDHLSTSASYACVWAPDGTRESIFAALKARRTYGATAKIRMVFRCGEHWMGERIEGDGELEFAVEVEGTAAVEELEWVVDGEVVETVKGDGERLGATFVTELEGEGEHWVYVHVTQVDGNEAWSSPIWVRK